MSRRVLVLCLSFDREPWRTIEAEARVTWASGPDGDAPVRYLYGATRGPGRALVELSTKALRFLRFDPLLTRLLHKVGERGAGRPVRRDGDRIVTAVPETYLNTNAKTVAAFRNVLLTEEFDFLLRTNTSTYVNRRLLLDFVGSLPTRLYYGGYRGLMGDLEFASGTGILLSRDLVAVAAEDRSWEFNLVDDIALARSMRRHSVDLRSFSRLDLLEEQDLEKLQTEDLTASFLVRCKGNDKRSHDVVAMRKVHDAYTKMGLVP